MKTLLAAGAMALALSCPAVATAGTPSDVTLRVEGLDSTLVAKTAVTTTDTPVSNDGNPDHACSGTSAVGALELATGGDWNGYWDDNFGQSIEEIRGESHPFDPDSSRNYYWTFWNNYEYQNAGACQTELQTGDEVLFSLGCFGDCASPTPLRLTLAGRAAPGQAVIAKVTEYVLVCDENYSCATQEQPSQGATVDAAGQSLQTGADGTASFTPGARGPQSVRATKADFIPTATESVCVTDGADGFCGTTKPGETPAPSQPVTPCETNGSDGRCGTVDRQAPESRVVGIADGERFRKRRKAPRELKGTVAVDPSGLHAVKIRFVRRAKGDCWGLSKLRDRMIRIRCSRPFWIQVGDRADWSWLLDGKLRRGRYSLDVRTTDKVFNKETLERGRNSIRFRVG